MLLVLPLKLSVRCGQACDTVQCHASLNTIFLTLKFLLNSKRCTCN